MEASYRMANGDAIYDKELIQKLKERFRSLTIQNDFIFYHVMKNKHLCRELLCRILGMRYKDAKDTIIIFICMTSPIKKGLPIYTFKNLCEEDPHIALEDGTLKVILCPREWRKVQDAKIRAVLKYIYDGIPVDNYTKELDMCVTDIKYDEVISNESLSYFFKMQDAREEGREEGICETARNMRANNCDATFIAKMTGLTIEEIERL